MTDRELIKMALDALNNVDSVPYEKVDEITKALRERLAQPELEPVAWHEPGAYGNVTTHKGWALANGWLPLYIAPPKREWVGLTDGEMVDLLKECEGRLWVDGFRAIEAKLKEKNCG